ncbi:MAG: TonB-dependent receptor [Pseudomonadota bacterium]
MLRHTCIALIAALVLLPPSVHAQPVAKKNQAVKTQKAQGSKKVATPTEKLPVKSEEHPVAMPVLEIVGIRQNNDLTSSSSVIDNKTLRGSRVFTANEALRKVPGVVTRDEEGFGVRPNIGIRGVNPTRSQKILLLEDGIPFTWAPYGANEAYYHPPVDRFDRIEVLKGAAMNVYGPQNLVGTINYITPTPPDELTASVAGTLGSRNYFNTHAQIGGNGLLLDFVRKSGDGARDNTRSEIHDANLKGVFSPAPGHALTARVNVYNEASDVSYTGITDAEARNFGLRYNPFTNDTFDIGRQGVVLTHEWTPSADLTLLTNAYYNHTARDWWRQSSSTTDAQCNPSVPTFSADRLAGIAVNVNACLSAQGRLREYGTAGIEPRLTYRHGLFGAANELLVAGRVYYESQDRQQKNGATPTARDGVLVEDNERRAQVNTLIVQNRFGLGALTLEPSLRYENINYDRRNLLAPFGAGDDTVNEIVPALGLTFALSEQTTLFGGVHRGFAPPRVEDLINGAGGAIEVGSEESLNAEAGIRTRPRSGLQLEAAAFRNDFHRQVAVGNVAGGSVPLATGQTLYEGFEFAGRADLAQLSGLPLGPFAELAVTYIPTAKQTAPLRRVDTGAVVGGSAAGLRLPYSPRFTTTGTLGLRPTANWELRFETVHVGGQFSDFAETTATNGTGQVGFINSYTIFNAATHYTLRPLNLTLFLTAKNLSDETYIVDRVRGILPGAPALVQGGFEYSFF